MSHASNHDARVHACTMDSGMFIQPYPHSLTQSCLFCEFPRMTRRNCMYSIFYTLPWLSNSRRASCRCRLSKTSRGYYEVLEPFLSGQRQRIPPDLAEPLTNSVQSIDHLEIPTRQSISLENTLSVDPNISGDLRFLKNLRNEIRTRPRAGKY